MLAMFIDHVRQVVFVDKIVTLQGLLHEYKSIMETNDLPKLSQAT